MGKLKNTHKDLKWMIMNNKFINKIKKKIIKFQACTYKSQNVAQSQLNFAPSHDGEIVTFRNSGLWGRP